MKSLEQQLDLINAPSDSCYFEYIEQKLNAGKDVRTAVVEFHPLENRLAQFAKAAKDGNS